MRPPASELFKWIIWNDDAIRYKSLLFLWIGCMWERDWINWWCMCVYVSLLLTHSLSLFCSHPTLQLFRSPHYFLVTLCRSAWKICTFKMTCFESVRCINMKSPFTQNFSNQLHNVNEWEIVAFLLFIRVLIMCDVGIKVKTMVCMLDVETYRRCKKGNA